ncbi:10932_t:CDS:10 [Scutellospora calospora]|uniref:10932_t:CDS:1 n=1 Tax=Scutellospora calospora TaxID=85575 RepID=A0ACA9JUP2_9GLOM|nr:10932_t:CDS:10 [Scutellospora calospora]
MIQFTPLNADTTPSQSQILVDPLDAPADNNGIPLAQRITRLKYCILRNYGEIFEKEYEMQKTMMDAQNAIEYYKRALQIDPSDHSIRLKIGRLAMSEEINDRESALWAFKKILEDINIIPSSVNSEESCSMFNMLIPSHKDALEEYCRLLYDFGEFQNCLNAIDKGLTFDPYNRVLNQLRSQLLKDTWVKFLLPRSYYETAPPLRHSFLLETVPRRIKSSGHFTSATVSSYHIHLQNTTWAGLGELLLDTYDGMLNGRIKLENDTHTSKRIVIGLEITKPSPTIDLNGTAQKRKRKEVPTDSISDKSMNLRVNRKASKITDEINTFNNQRSKLASAFTEKIESTITKLDPDFWLNDQLSNIDDQTDKFLEYFTKAWTFHVSREDHVDMIEQAINTSRPKATSDPRFYRFTPNTKPYVPASYFIDSPEAHSMLIAFIEKMNDINSGILDCLCMYVMHLFGHFVRSDDGTFKALWLCRWPDNLKEVTRVILSRIDRSLLEMIENSCTSWDEKSNLVEIMMNDSEDNIFTQMKQKSEIIMGICEFLSDSQIMSTRTTTSYIGQQTSTDVQEIPLTLQSTLDICKKSLVYSYWNMQDFVNNAGICALNSEIGDEWSHHYDIWKTWSSQLNARLWWCIARMELWKGELDKSIMSFEQCKQSYAFGEHKDDIVIVNCGFDSNINLSNINYKICILESSRDESQSEWTRTVSHFTDSIKFLQNAVSDVISQDRIIHFWATIHSVNESLVEVIRCLSIGNKFVDLAKNDQKTFKRCLHVLYSTALEVIFPRSMKLERATAEISEPLNILCVRTWVLFCYLLRQYVSNSVTDDFADFLEAVHDQLGVRHICGIDNGIFLKFVLKTLTELHPSDYRQHEYQCCHCLYRVSLSVDTTPPKNHNTPAVDLDHETAELLFREIRNYLNQKSDKMYKAWAIKNDVKDTLDKIANMFPPPRDDRFSKCSWKTRHFLDDDINFYEAVQYKEHNHDVKELGSVSGRDSDRALADLYYFRGKILLNQFKTRSKANVNKAVDMFASWYALGICYANLADENLTWSAAEINDNRAEIANYQKKSFQCFARASKVIHLFSNQQLTTPIEEINFWRDYGYQVYAMMSEPMSMEAFSLSPCHAEIWCKPDDTQACQFAAYCFGKALELESQLLKQSDIANITPEYTPNDTPNETAHNSPYGTPVETPTNSSVASTNGSASTVPIVRDWRIPYMVGKCYQRLRKKPEVVIQLYKLAVSRTPERSGIAGQEKILDAEYKLTSSLAKYLITNKIKPSFVEQSIGFTDDDTATIDYTNEGSVFNIQRPEYQRAYNLICMKLENIRKADKNKWHHRPVFRLALTLSMSFKHAWLINHVEQKPEEAKALLQNLFQLKASSNKSVMNVWKPEFERAGRHFVYVHEYILFLIELARSTRDISTLKTMDTKLSKAVNILLKESIIRACMANAFQYVEQARSLTIMENNDQDDAENLERYEPVLIIEHTEQSNVMSVAALITQDDVMDSYN